MGPAPADTVVALSSAPGASERAILRLSGPAAWSLAGAVFQPPPRRPWRRVAGELRLPGWPPAPAELLAFRGPASYTGEDLVELWVPGAPPLVRRLLRELSGAGARLAERGEFTRRAFLHGRLDLNQVEAVLTLTRGEEAAQARAAARALAGGVREALERVKLGLLELLAHVEAAIDFSEEELDHAPAGELGARIEAVAEQLAAAFGRSRRRPGDPDPVVVLCGPANAGKSTLFNALLGEGAEDGALVSPQAGTTRDVLAGTWTLPGGLQVRLLDTAGAKPSVGPIEEQALAVAREAARGADLLLCLQPAGAPPGDPPPEGPCLRVRSKADLGQGDPAPGELRLSARTGAGLEALGRAVAERLSAETAGGGGELIASARQERLLEDALQALERARALLLGRDPARAELAAVDLGEALGALGELTGAVDIDALLEEIFARFCVGK